MGIVDLFFPVICLGCKSSGYYLCRDCLKKVKKAKQVCIECGKASIDGFTHVKCRRPQSVDGVFSIWEYAGVVKKAILKMKYNFATDIAKELSDIAVNYIKKEFTPFRGKVLLVPIPLHRTRSNWRGFNQTEEIGKLIAQNLGWDFNSEILIRKKKTRPQVELKGDKRKENVRGVFALNKSYKSLILSSSSLVIFDDVLTTGATIKEAAKVLKRSGAKSVWGLSISS